MERKNKILIFLVLICTLIIIVFIVNLPLNKEVISTKFVLGENMGFDLTPGKLNFGKITPNNSASREITVENNYDKLIRVNIKSSGEISENMIVSENNFILAPLESKNVVFSVYTFGLTEFRDYKGKISIVSRVIY